MMLASSASVLVVLLAGSQGLRARRRRALCPLPKTSTLAPTTAVVTAVMTPILLLLLARLLLAVPLRTTAAAGRPVPKAKAAPTPGRFEVHWAWLVALLAS